MNIRIGNPVTGENYFPRQELRKEMLDSLKRDHIAFLGPRRTGKTSFLFSLRDKPPEPIVACYIDLQQLSTVPGWLISMIAETRRCLELPDEKWKWLKTQGESIVSLGKRLEELSVAMMKIKLTPGAPMSEVWLPLAEEFFQLISESEVPIYFLLDEFPWYLENLSKQHGVEEVKAALDWFRGLRIRLVDQPIRFLVTGSIGMKGLLRKLDLVNTVNDFDTVEIYPLQDNAAADYLAKGAESEKIILSDEAAARIIERLGVNWPILLATFLSEISRDQERMEPSVEDIDFLYENGIVRRRNKYCEEMFERLNRKNLFTDGERLLAQRIMREMCQEEGAAFGSDDIAKIHESLVPDAVLRARSVDDLNYVLETLRHDGYIVRIVSPDRADLDGKFRVSSHVLRDYWAHKSV